MDNIIISTPSFNKKNDILKLIAIITMVIDHIAYMDLLPSDYYFFSRTIGRIAFPIFAYYLAIGFTRTKNLKGYFMRILGFSVISQIPYSFFNPEFKFNPLHLNIMFTLLIGLISLYLLEKVIYYGKEFKEFPHFSILKNLIFYIIILIISVLSPEIIKTIAKIKLINLHIDYGSYGILLILSFYLFRNCKIGVLSSFLLISVIGSYLSVYNHILDTNGGNIIDALTNKYYMNTYFLSNKHITSLSGFWFQSRSIVGIILIIISDLWKNFEFRMNRYFGYLFYPIHIILIIIIKVLVK